ncbi:MAG: hypothetical protein ABIT08_10230 [Bacteroidia bacterium]
MKAINDVLSPVHIVMNAADNVIAGTYYLISTAAIYIYGAYTPVVNGVAAGSFMYIKQLFTNILVLFT